MSVVKKAERRDKSKTEGTSREQWYGFGGPEEREKMIAWMKDVLHKKAHWLVWFILVMVGLAFLQLWSICVRFLQPPYASWWDIYVWGTALWLVYWIARLLADYGKLHFKCIGAEARAVNMESGGVRFRRKQVFEMWKSKPIWWEEPIVVEATDAKAWEKTEKEQFLEQLQQIESRIRRHAGKCTNICGRYHVRRRLSSSGSVEEVYYDRWYRVAWPCDYIQRTRQTHSVPSLPFFKYVVLHRAYLPAPLRWLTHIQS